MVKKIEFDAPEKIFLIIFKDMKDDLEREHDDMSVNTDRVVRVDLGHLHGVDHLLYQPHLHNPMQKDIYKNLTSSSHFTILYNNIFVYKNNTLRILYSKIIFTILQQHQALIYQEYSFILGIYNITSCS